MDLIVPGGLIGQIALAGVGVHRSGNLLGAAFGEDLSPFPEQHLFVG